MVKGKELLPEACTILVAAFPWPPSKVRVFVADKPAILVKSTWPV